MSVSTAATSNEADRIARLRELVILDSAPEPVFDSIARMASDICGAPIALISLIDMERQWFKANVGLPGFNETPRDVAFCDHAIRSDAVFEVPDAHADSRFSHNPMVTGAPDIRFYAGAPLILPGGQRIGTLCVLDRETRHMTDAQIAMLRSLAAIASEALVMRQELIVRSLSIGAEQEGKLRELIAIIDNTTDFVTQVDTRGNVIYMNPAARRTTGIAADAPLIDVNYIRFNTPETYRLHAEVILPALQETGVWVGETTVYGEHQREIPVSHMVIAHRDGNGKIERYSTVMRDISGDVAAKRDLARQTGILRSVSDAIPDIVAVLGDDLCYRFVNSAFERWVGAPRQTIIGQPMLKVLGRKAFDRMLPSVQRALAGETVIYESNTRHKGGVAHRAISIIPLRMDDGSIDGVVAVAQDVTMQKREEMRLRELSQRDPLTGLLNRAGFEQYLERALIEGSGPSLALLYIDLDHFKPINDQYGHPVGDQALQRVAQRLCKAVRPTDGVARLGGDEFAIVLSGVNDRANANAVAEKLISSIMNPFDVGGIELAVSASVGVAFAVNPAGGWADLVARADANLYKAKAAGRGRYAGEPD